MRTLTLTLGLALVGAAHADAIRWSDDFKAGMAASKSTHRLAIVDFYTDW